VGEKIDGLVEESRKSKKKELGSRVLPLAPREESSFSNPLEDNITVTLS